MEWFGIIEFIIKIFSFLARRFWKNKNIVFCNSNVKNCNIEELRPFIQPSDAKIVKVQTRGRGIKGFKWHFTLMRIKLMIIKYNMGDMCQVYHCGFASQMFAVYDGYTLGNTNTYNFIDYDNAYYKIERVRFVEDNSNCNIPKESEEINLIVETSYDIDKSKCNNCYSIEMHDKAPARITKKYLNKVYGFVKAALDACCNSNVKNVNLYITAKPSVAFAVGAAIQNYHPKVKVYEYQDNNYMCYLSVKDNKIVEVRNNG